MGEKEGRGHTALPALSFIHSAVTVCKVRCRLKSVDASRARGCSTPAALTQTVAEPAIERHLYCSLVALYRGSQISHHFIVRAKCEYTGSSEASGCKKRKKEKEKRFETNSFQFVSERVHGLFTRTLLHASNFAGTEPISGEARCGVFSSSPRPCVCVCVRLAGCSLAATTAALLLLLLLLRLRPQHGAARDVQLFT